MRTCDKCGEEKEVALGMHLDKPDESLKKIDYAICHSCLAKFLGFK